MVGEEMKKLRHKNACRNQNKLKQYGPERGGVDRKAPSQVSLFGADVLRYHSLVVGKDT